MTDSLGDKMPLKVLLTFDIEVWCGGWDRIDEKFPGAFRRYVYGQSRAGNYALPKTLEILNRYDLKGIFFVEPLFASRFGIEPLAEIVGLIKAAGQEVQMHLHPEWQNEARQPLIANHLEKRQGLNRYTLDEQVALIGHGIRLLQEAGASRPTAFRSGGFNCNADTFLALERNGIFYDSSLNVTLKRSGEGLPPGQRQPQAHFIGKVLELPLSVFSNARGGLRHVQFSACSFPELRQILDGARANGWSYVNLLSHNFEMLLRDSSRPDWVVVQRFERLCRHLAEHRDVYHTTCFADDGFRAEASSLRLPVASKAATAQRLVEQGYRRVLETAARWGN